jgi:hypothetical protein
LRRRTLLPFCHQNPTPALTGAIGLATRTADPVPRCWSRSELIGGDGLS